MKNIHAYHNANKNKKKYRKSIAKNKNIHINILYRINKSYCNLQVKCMKRTMREKKRVT